MANLCQMFDECLICLEKNKILVPLQQLLTDCGQITVGEVLLNMHFFTILDNASFCRSLCSTCATKSQTCYQLKRKCDRIENKLETGTDLKNSQLSSSSTTKSANDHENTKVIIEKANPSNLPLKSEIDIDEEFIFTTNDSNQSRSLNKDETIHGGKKSFNCGVCNESFSSMKYLTSHKKIHNDDMSYVCDVCKKTFLNINAFKRHTIFYKCEKSYVCNVCNKSFKRSITLRRHKINHITKESNISEKLVCNLNSSTNHETTETIEKDQIDNCNKSLDQPSVLNEETIIYFGNKTYVCDVCNKSLSSMQCLTYHKMIHTGEKPHVCDICQKAFIRVNDLTMHKRLHNRKESYVCDVCNKAFEHPSLLSRHKIIHS